MSMSKTKKQHQWAKKANAKRKAIKLEPMQAEAQASRAKAQSSCRTPLKGIVSKSFDIQQDSEYLQFFTLQQHSARSYNLNTIYYK